MSFITPALVTEPDSYPAFSTPSTGELKNKYFELKWKGEQER